MGIPPKCPSHTPCSAALHGRKPLRALPSRTARRVEISAPNCFLQLPSVRQMQRQRMRGHCAESPRNPRRLATRRRSPKQVSTLDRCSREPGTRIPLRPESSTNRSPAWPHAIQVESRIHSLTDRFQARPRQSFGDVVQCSSCLGLAGSPHNPAARGAGKAGVYLSYWHNRSYESRDRSATSG